MLKLVRSLVCRRAVALVLTFAAVAATAAFVAPQPSEAGGIGRCGLEFIYYDSTYTEVVGYRAYEPPECGCYLYSWGSITPYREIYDFYC